MRNPSSRARLTYQDLLGLPEDLLRHELIDGKHLMSPAPTPKHQQAVVNLTGLIWSYLQRHPLGRLYVAPTDVVFSDFDVVEPDVIYVSHQRRDRYLTERCLAGPPELVVEVLSPSTRRIDEGAKLRLFERYGVSEYWIVDPIQETVRVYRLTEGNPASYRLKQELRRPHPGRQPNSPRLADSPGLTATLSTPLLPGLQLTLDQIFA
jgi:Uma2 family endonuclease